MRIASLAEHATDTGYLVMAPHAGDILSVTLRAAYAADPGPPDQFGDVLRQLDLIELAPRRALTAN